MCTSPIHILNKSSYFHSAVDYVSFDVPCSHCDECRSIQQSEWELRLSFELAYFKGIGGIAVFLTFTYNDSHLPWLINEDYSERIEVPCFNADDILYFLDKLNNVMQYEYGKESYKYFIAAEYGKNTQRPHYHGLFMLKPGVNWRWFVEFCRDLWNDKGFMFPYYSQKLDCWLDNKRHPSTPLLKGFDPASGVPLYAGAKYVSKYVTKDISYFQLNPKLADAYKSRDFRKTYSKKLPKHWQSNGIGYSIFKNLDTRNIPAIDDIICNGIANPLDPSKSKMMLPTFVVNKLMYRNVLSDRVSPTTGKKLYDRKLTMFGRRYLKLQYVRKVEKTASKISKIFQFIEDTEKPLLYDFHLSRLGITDVSDSISLFPIAIYHVLLKHLSPRNIKNFLRCHDADELFEVTSTARLYTRSKDYRSDKLALRSHESEFYSSADEELCSDLFYSVKYLDDAYSSTSRECAERRARLFRENEEKKQYTRYLFKYRYDKSLC